MIVNCQEFGNGNVPKGFGELTTDLPLALIAPDIIWQVSGIGNDLVGIYPLRGNHAFEHLPSFSLRRKPNGARFTRPHCDVSTLRETDKSEDFHITTTREVS